MRDDWIALLSVAAISVLFGGILGLSIGIMSTDKAWGTDCLKIGGHVSSGGTYNCSPKEEKK